MPTATRTPLTLRSRPHRSPQLQPGNLRSHNDTCLCDDVADLYQSSMAGCLPGLSQIGPFGHWQYPSDVMPQFGTTGQRCAAHHFATSSAGLTNVAWATVLIAPPSAPGTCD